MQPIMYFLTMGVLFLLLLVASWQDYCGYSIRNALILSGALLGVSLNTFLPIGIGILDSLAGCAIGLLLLLPFYVLRMMGAGDVKLMAVVGAFVGSNDILGAFLSTLIAGGVLALIVALHKGMLRRLLNNLTRISMQMLWIDKSRSLQDSSSASEATADSIEKLPYAIAIAIGTITFLTINHRVTF